MFTQLIQPKFDDAFGYNRSHWRTWLRGGPDRVLKTMDAQADRLGNIVLDAAIEDGGPYAMLDFEPLDSTGVFVGDTESNAGVVTKLFHIPSISREMNVHFAVDVDVPHAHTSGSPFHLKVERDADVMVSAKFVLDVTLFPNSDPQPTRIEQEFFRADRFNNDVDHTISRPASSSYIWDTALMIPPGIDGMWLHLGAELTVQRVYHGPENPNPWSKVTVNGGSLEKPTVRINQIWVEGR